MGKSTKQSTKGKKKKVRASIPDEQLIQVMPMLTHNYIYWLENLKTGEVRRDTIDVDARTMNKVTDRLHDKLKAMCAELNKETDVGSWEPTGFVESDHLQQRKDRSKACASA